MYCSQLGMTCDLHEWHCYGKYNSVVDDAYHVCQHQILRKSVVLSNQYWLLNCLTPCDQYLYMSIHFCSKIPVYNFINDWNLSSVPMVAWVLQVFVSPTHMFLRVTTYRPILFIFSRLPYNGWDHHQQCTVCRC